MGWDEQESATEDKLLEDSDAEPGRGEIIVLFVFFRRWTCTAIAIPRLAAKSPSSQFVHLERT